MYSLLDSNSEWTAKLIDIRTKVSPLLWLALPSLI